MLNVTLRFNELKADGLGSSKEVTTTIGYPLLVVIYLIKLLRLVFRRCFLVFVLGLCTHVNFNVVFKFETVVLHAILGISNALHSLPKAAGLSARQLYANTTSTQIIHSPSGATIRYKEPGKDGICETTYGVNSYSGYVEVSPSVHTFFWFFESRHQPENAQTT